ncbi:MAG: hypothetical protein OEY64_02885 [Nitrospinota bacterium]|nr:hypothetical protein [Nitrospinota bacterium]
MAGRIDPQTRLAKKYTKIFGHCRHCEAPIWFSRVIDNTGTPLLTYHCWNGHYEAIDAQILNLYRRGDELSQEDIKRILPFIKFVRLAG